MGRGRIPNLHLVVSGAARPHDALDKAARIAVVWHLIVAKHGLRFLHTEGAPCAIQALHRVVPMLEGLFAPGDDVSLRG